jgi:hypothetical protein
MSAAEWIEKHTPGGTGSDFGALCVSGRAAQRLPLCRRDHRRVSRDPGLLARQRAPRTLDCGRKSATSGGECHDLTGIQGNCTAVGAWLRAARGT